MKKIILKNTNNRLNCEFFTHITLAPSASILESQMPLQVQIEDPANPSKIINGQLINLARLTLGDLSSVITYPASGLDREQFINQFKNENPGVDNNTPMAIYIYQLFL